MGAEAVYRRPWLYAKQQAAVFHAARYGVVEASTKSGKTVSHMAWLLEQAMRGTTGDHYWWAAPTYAQTEIAFRRFKAGLPRDVYTANETKLTLTLANDAMLWFKTGERPDALYGEDVQAAVIDEASRFREEAWHAIRSTVSATRGPLRMIGNVRGRKNWFYALCRRAEAGEPDMQYAKLTARDAVDAGILETAEVEDARRQLPEAVFRELFLAEAADDEGNPFGLDHLRRCLRPLSEAAPIAWGIDLARSVDWTVAIGLDAAGQVCRCARWQSPWEETHRRLLELVGEVPALVDCTGTGDAPFERLSRQGGSQFQGYLFTAASKQRLVEGLAVAIQHREVGFPEGPILAELESFEYLYSRGGGVRYSAPEGSHDDCVMALALAVACWQAQTHRVPLAILPLDGAPAPRRVVLTG